jgi:hypothetical protein
MDIDLALIIDLFKSLIWPFFLLTVILLFRKEVRDFSSKISSARANIPGVFEIEAQIKDAHKKATDLSKETENIELNTANSDTIAFPIKNIDHSLHDSIKDINKISALIAAKEDLLALLKNLSLYYDIADPDSVNNNNAPWIIHLLRSKAPNMVNDWSSLSQLIETAENLTENQDVPSESIIEYVEACQMVIQSIAKKTIKNKE